VELVPMPLRTVVHRTLLDYRSLAPVRQGETAALVWTARREVTEETRKQLRTPKHTLVILPKRFRRLAVATVVP
jgi:hypothetical protein